MSKGILGWLRKMYRNRFLGILGVIRLLRIVWIGSCTISLIPCESFLVLHLRCSDVYET